MNNRQRMKQRYIQKYFVKWRKNLLNELNRVVNKCIYGCE